MYSTHKSEQSQPGSEPRSRDLLPGQSFSGIFPIQKYRGETLAVLLERFRHEHSLDTETKLTYAGRLDPMAEGVVLVLAGESRFEKDALLGLPKAYDVDILLGVSTDTLDPLGSIENVEPKPIDQETIERAILEMKSITSLPYPMYSSVPVDGKPLFIHAREGTTVTIPQKKVTIYSAELLGIEKVSLSTLATRAIEDIQKVIGDFRQDTIINDWRQLETVDTEVQLVKVCITASSGTYMRSLTAWMGERLGVPALAYRIVRTKIGEYRT